MTSRRPFVPSQPRTSKAARERAARLREEERQWAADARLATPELIAEIARQARTEQDKRDEAEELEIIEEERRLGLLRRA